MAEYRVIKYQTGEYILKSDPLFKAQKGSAKAGHKYDARRMGPGGKWQYRYRLPNGKHVWSNSPSGTAKAGKPVPPKVGTKPQPAPKVAPAAKPGGPSAIHLAHEYGLKSVKVQAGGKTATAFYGKTPIVLKFGDEPNTVDKIVREDDKGHAAAQYFNSLEIGDALSRLQVEDNPWRKKIQERKAKESQSPAKAKEKSKPVQYTLNSGRILKETPKPTKAEQAGAKIEKIVASVPATGKGNRKIKAQISQTIRKYKEPQWQAIFNKFWRELRSTPAGATRDSAYQDAMAGKSKSFSKWVVRNIIETLKKKPQAK
jgi:hypothetical protein